MRHYYLFTGRKQGHPYAIEITPAGDDSYEAVITTAYPTDNTTSSKAQRRYPGNWTGQAIRGDMLRNHTI